MNRLNNNRIIVIGAGAGGMMAAGSAAESGSNVFLLEKMSVPGKKLLISGKTRCNLTNSAGLEHFIRMYGDNGRFLYSGFKRFFREGLLSFFHRYGVETETEKDGRIFPSSNDSRDVVIALQKYMTDNGVKMQKNISASRIIIKDGEVTGVQCGNEIYPAKAVILAAGGSSYPETGSTGDGTRLALAAGHSIVPLRPALVPLAVREKKLAEKMQGVSLHDIRLTSYQCKAAEINPAGAPSSDTGRGIEGKKPHFPVVESRRGDMLFTHFGISGPAALKMSLAIVDALETGPVSISIDLFPESSLNQLEKKLRENLGKHGNKSFLNLIKQLVPPRVAVAITEVSGIPTEKHCNQITAQERDTVIKLLKSFRLNVKGPLSMESAMVTAGGVSLKEIDPRTMASRLIRGLYFCGEVMDIDAETGGYNLQAAFSTGFISGESAAAFVSGSV